MGKYFSFEELCYSATAEQLKINNKPTSTEVVKNLNELIDVLDIIRQEWTDLCAKKEWGDGAIIVSSGYRSRALNEALNGAVNSSHMIGSTVDMYPQNGKNKEFFDFLDLWLLTNNILFDQLINEKPDENGVPSWVHFSLKNRKGEQRRTVFSIK
jgi:hypothetical protein